MPDHFRLFVTALVALQLATCASPFRGQSGSLSPTASAITSASGTPVASGRASPALLSLQQSATLRLPGEPGTVSALAWSPDAKLLAVSSRTGTAWVQLLRPDGSVVATVEGTDAIASGVAWAPDGSKLALADSRNAAQIRDVEGRLLATLRHGGELSALAWSPDGRTLATSFTDRPPEPRLDFRVQLWDVATAQPTALLIGHTSSVGGLAWAPDGTALVSGSQDGTIRRWATDGRPRGFVVDSGPSIRKLAWSPDGATLAGISDAGVQLWRPDGQPVGLVAALPTGPSRFGAVQPFDLAWSPDSQSIAVAMSNTVVRLWSTTGSLLAATPAHPASVWSVAWSPDGTTLAVGGSEGAVWLWRVGPGSQGHLDHRTVASSNARRMPMEHEGS